MKIGVVSDTHIEDLGGGLVFFDALCRGPFAEVDHILHAGDIVHPDLVHCFTSKPMTAVRGNCDEPAAGLPVQRVVELGGCRIGMVHGQGGPDGIVAYVLDCFSGEEVDVIVFGHSHEPLCRQQGGTLLFNPGSATDRRYAPFHSVGILELGDVPTGQIVNLDAYTDLFVLNSDGACL